MRIFGHPANTNPNGDPACVFIWFNTLWLLPISKSEYFNEKYNSILIGFWLIYPVTDSWKFIVSMKNKTDDPLWNAIDDFESINSQSRYLVKDIYDHTLINLWLFPWSISTFSLYFATPFNLHSTKQFRPFTPPIRSFLIQIYPFPTSINQSSPYNSIIILPPLTIPTPQKIHTVGKNNKSTNRVSFWKSGLNRPLAISISGNTKPIPGILCASYQPCPPSPSPLPPFARDLVWRAAADRFNPIAKSLALLDIGTHVRTRGAA